MSGVTSSSDETGSRSHPQPGTGESTGQRLRRAFGWSALGNYLYAAAQFGVLLVITATGPPVDTAAFLVALAVTGPVFLTLSMNLRAVLASDSGGGFDLRTYIGARALTSTGSLAVVVAIAWFVGVQGGPGMEIGLMALARAIAEWNNLAQGAYLNAEKHRYVAISQVGQAVLGYGSFCVVYVATGSIGGSTLALAAGWMASIVLVDSVLLSRIAQRLRPIQGPGSVWQLIRKAAPLGIERGASALAAYLPLIALDVSAASVTVVAAFGVVTQTLRVVQVLARSTSFALIPAMSKFYADQDFATLRHIVVRAQKALLVVGAVVLGLAFLFGDQLLSVVFGAEYVVDGLVEVVALNSTAVLFLALVTAGLISTRRFNSVLAVRLVAIIASAILLLVLTPTWGAIGAASAAVVGNALATVVGSFALRAAGRPAGA